MKRTKSKALTLDLDSFSVKIRDLISSDLQYGNSINPDVTEFLREKHSQECLSKWTSANRPRTSSLRTRAIDLFQGINARLADFTDNHRFDDSDLDSERYDGNENRFILRRARALCSTILGESVEIDELFQECKHGPNTSLGVDYFDSGNSAKWQLPLTCSDSAAGLMELYFQWDTTLKESMQRRYPYYGLKSLFPHLKIENRSRLTTVPKNDEKDRTIAIEPTANMFMQQAVGRILVDRLEVFGVDIEGCQQDKHRLMAFLSSLTRSYATIDWSSASDCVSLSLVKYLLPPQWYYLVEKLRVPNVYFKSENRSTVEIPLNCVSSMGNGFTFALETLVFFCIACASLPCDNPRSRFVKYESFKSVFVFGDDCILPSESAASFIEAMKHVGFIVNEKKTFIDPACGFRESCGADFLRGHNVRPYYLRSPRSLKSSVVRSWLYTVWNGVYNMLINSIGPRNVVYSETLQYLAEVISCHNDQVLIVAATDPEDSGLKTNGDWGRIRHLFPAHKWPSFVSDDHGTIRYHKLVSVSPASGTFIHEFEYWFNLKFPSQSVIKITKAYSKEKRFPFAHLSVLKQDRGYVVGVSTDCGDAFVDVIATYACC